MKVIAERFWKEPAVAIGFLVSLALLVYALIDDSFDAQSIVGILAPLVSALGIRQLVTPAKEDHGNSP